MTLGLLLVVVSVAIFVALDFILEGYMRRTETPLVARSPHERSDMQG